MPGYTTKAHANTAGFKVGFELATFRIQFYILCLFKAQTSAAGRAESQGRRRRVGFQGPEGGPPFSDNDPLSLLVPRSLARSQPRELEP